MKAAAPISIFLIAATLAWVVADRLLFPSARRLPSHFTVEGHGSLVPGRGTRIGTDLLYAKVTTFADSARFLRAVEEASASTLEDWLRALSKGGASDRFEKMELLGAKLASLDPRRAVDFLRQHRGLEGLLGTAFLEWADQDLSAAVERALELEPGGRLISQLAREIHSGQAEALYDLLVERDLAKQNSAQYGYLLASLYDSGAVEAAEKALRHELVYSAHSVFRLSIGLSEIFRRWSEDDPRALLAWVDELDDAVEKDIVLYNLARAWGGRDPLTGFETLWPRLDSKQQNALIDEIRYEHAVADGDFDETLTWIDDNIHSTELHGKALVGLLEGLRYSQFPERLTEIVSLLDPSTHGLARALEHAAREWAAIDGDALEAWIETQDDPRIRSAAQSGLLTHWSRVDASKTLELLPVMETSAAADAVASWGFFEQLLLQVDEPREAFALIPEPLRGSAINAHSKRLAQESPVEIFELLRAQDPNAERDSALQYALAQWATSDPESVAARVEAFEEGALGDDAARNLVNTWARFDIEGATGWLESREPGPGRDAAAEELVRAHLSRQPDMALTLAQSIDDRERRVAMMADSLEALASIDPNRTKNELDRVELPEHLRRRVENRIRDVDVSRQLFR